MIVNIPSASRTRNTRAILLFTLGSLLVLILFWLAVYRPAVTELRRLRAQTEGTQTTLRDIEQIQSEYGKVAQAYQAASTEAETFLSQFPKENDLPAIITAVNAVAQRRGVQTEFADCGQVEWEDALGRAQITALFVGQFGPLAATVADLEQVLTSASLDRLRISAVRDKTAEVSSPATGSTLHRALGLENTSTPGVLSSPLAPDHLEAHVVLTVWMITDDGLGHGHDESADSEDHPTLTRILNNGGQWYARLPGRHNLPTNDPFQPPARAQELVELARLAERYADLRITGIARSSSKYVASVEYLGQNYRVSPGDHIGEARVTAIDKAGITLNIRGRSIPIEFGGER